MILRARVAVLRFGVAFCGFVMGEVNSVGAAWSRRLRELEARL